MQQNPVIQVLAADTKVPQIKYWPWLAKDHPDYFSEAELDELVANYDPALHEAPLTLDHVQEGEALGWVSKLEKRDKTLWAHLRDVDETLVGKVRQKRYKKISSELSLNFQDLGKLYFTGVSFLGAGKPAVKGMSDPLLSEDGNTLLLFSKDDKKIVCAPELELSEKVFGEEEIKKTEPKGEPKMAQETKDLMPVEIENERLQRENLEKEKRLAEVYRRRKLESIAAKLDAFGALGKITPAQRKPLEVILAVLPDDAKVRYDGKDQSLHDILYAFVENLKPSMKFGMMDLGEAPDGAPAVDPRRVPRGINAEDVDGASAQLDAYAQEIRIRDKCDYMTALTKANKEHPEIYAATVKTR